MFTFKNKNIYFLIFLLFMGINLFKNIYIEQKVDHQLKEKGLITVESINCYGFFNIECQLKALSLEQNISNTSYLIKSSKNNLLSFNILDTYQEINDFKLIAQDIKIFDSRGVFLELKKSIDINVTSHTKNAYSKVDIDVLHENLEIKIILTLLSQNFSGIDIEVKRDNDVIKKIIHELYKVKLLEIIETDDKDFSTTRGMNIPLGIDTNKVIPQDVFLGEPYEAMSILLSSEIETFDWVVEYGNDNVINFLNDIMKNNGVNQLQITTKKEKNDE